MTTSKVCFCCRLRKPLDEFHARKSRQDGRDGKCKLCACAYAKAHRDANIERHTLSLMIQRCHNEKNKDFHHYGGRGISVADVWRKEGGFDLFLAHVGPRPSPKHEIDRIDNALGYKPGNVRWATRREQSRNTRVNKLITIDGVTRCHREWEELRGFKKGTVRHRIAIGWSPTDAVLRPIQRQLTQGRYDDEEGDD